MEQEYLAGITGKIIYLNPKGWGFINTRSIEFEKVYFHWSGLNNKKAPNFKDLKQNDEVKFNAHKRTNEEGKEGWKAIKIEVIGYDQKGSSDSKESSRKG